MVGARLRDMVYEYAHSFMAYVLHAKVNPFALDYGDLNLEGLLSLSDIDENVDYSPLFAWGRNHAAGLIAVGGCSAMVFHTS